MYVTQTLRNSYTTPPNAEHSRCTTLHTVTQLYTTESGRHKSGYITQRFIRLHNYTELNLHNSEPDPHRYEITVITVHCYATRCYGTWPRYATLHSIMLQDATVRGHGTPRYTALCYKMLRYTATVRHATQHYATRCYKTRLPAKWPSLNRVPTPRSGKNVVDSSLERFCLDARTLLSACGFSEQRTDYRL